MKYDILKYISIIPAIAFLIAYIDTKNNLVFVFAMIFFVLYVLFITISTLLDNNIKKEKLKDLKKSQIKDL
jgi:hypothetical protein